MRTLTDKDYENQIFNVSCAIACHLMCRSIENWDTKKLKDLANKWDQLMDDRYKAHFSQARRA